MRMSQEQFLWRTWRTLVRFSKVRKIALPENPRLPDDHELFEFERVRPSLELVLLDLIEAKGFHESEAVSVAHQSMDYFLLIEKDETLPEPSKQIRDFAISITNVVAKQSK